MTHGCTWPRHKFVASIRKLIARSPDDIADSVGSDDRDSGRAGDDGVVEREPHVGGRCVEWSPVDWVGRDRLGLGGCASSPRASRQQYEGNDTDAVMRATRPGCYSWRGGWRSSRSCSIRWRTAAASSGSSMSAMGGSSNGGDGMGNLTSCDSGFDREIPARDDVQTASHRGRGAPETG